ncbi:3,4-dihydroxy-2-butanone-4-phosphate synthase [Chitinimonas sp.]|uniref:3,4-dihydroxy-2-butanone-4-phosphate synthase n=1 Tax=Chitinimonas sp. TaxID=1934313 RepID=UPI0035B35B0B
MFEQYFQSTTPNQRVAAAIAAIAAGGAVALLDDIDRENEGDLIVAAERVSVPQMVRLIRDCTGIVCLSLSAERVEQLGLPPMVADNRSRYGTPFTVSIEAREGVSTGVSAADRVATTRAALSGDPGAIVSPGHIFPLRATPGGVLARRGHTEGAVDLAVLAGLAPGALLCELMRDDGEMMRGEEIVAYGLANRVPVLTIDDLVQWRLQQHDAATPWVAQLDAA